MGGRRYWSPTSSSKKGLQPWRITSQLTHRERYLISRCKARGWGVRQTADLLLDRSPGAISRELDRNAAIGDGVYRTDRATVRPPPGVESAEVHTFQTRLSKM